MGGLDPAWLTNVLLVIGGWIVKRAMSELQDVRQDLDDIKLLIARQYITKDEAKEMVDNRIRMSRSDVVNDLTSHYWTRAEGDMLQEEVRRLRGNVH